MIFVLKYPPPLSKKNGRSALPLASLWPPFATLFYSFSTPFLLLSYSFLLLGGEGGVWDLEMFVILPYKGAAPRGPFIGENDGNSRHSRL